MDDKDYEQIEAEALQIIGTINRLKEEIEEYKQAKIGTKKSLKSLDLMLDAMTEAAQSLKTAGEEISKSDFVTLSGKIESIPTDIDKTLSEQSRFQKEQFADVKELIRTNGENSSEQESEIARRIESLEAVIARIDRNTQKGFGKERG
ncbi:hypothetical protein [Slackia isoflavoniconvertens]|uniref:hypothetical protein n=1 Tax=Slackia isoflavoniconvertens TaxID=572010 RepID=UPI003FD6C0DE